ncbi:hypothetical protein A2U01_0074813, partial [Trifolium medium]|nr:hypothetical protein [Trifolium medium]
MECLRCAEMKTEQLGVELQRFFGAYDITEMITMKTILALVDAAFFIEVG